MFVHSKGKFAGQIFSTQSGRKIFATTKYFSQRINIHNLQIITKVNTPALKKKNF